MAIDFRSDTVTMPSSAMLKLMASAKVGDDVYREDSSVCELEEYGANLVGKEAALFVASGTMGNLVSIMTHETRGNGVILGRKSHIYISEGGGIAVLAGAFPLGVNDDFGVPNSDEVRAQFYPKNVHLVSPKLLCLENTHNGSGGIALSPEVFSNAVRVGRSGGLAVHLDGARIFNASVAWNVDVKQYTQIVDTIQICLSKGLGAPVGSLVCASSAFIEEARYWRKKVGGGMRQAGVIAAAGLYALKNNIRRLAEDHEKAQYIADTLQSEGWKVEQSSKRTNMVYFEVPAPADPEQFLFACARRGVLFFILGGKRRVRIVPNLDTTMENVIEAVKIMITVYSELI